MCEHQEATIKPNWHRPSSSALKRRWNISRKMSTWRSRPSIRGYARSFWTRTTANGLRKKGDKTSLRVFHVLLAFTLLIINGCFFLGLTLRVILVKIVIPLSWRSSLTAKKSLNQVIAHTTNCLIGIINQE